MTISDTRLAQLGARFAELEARLASGTLEGAEFIAASRDYAELEPVARAAAAVGAMRGAVRRFEPAMAGDVREERLARWRRALAAAVPAA